MSFFLVRHGERADQCPHPAEKAKVVCKFDSHLTPLGLRMAQESGKLVSSQIKRLISSKVLSPSCKVVLISSPFLRCLQTSNEILKNITGVEVDKEIHIETGISERLDAKDFQKDDYPANINFFKRPEVTKEALGDRPINAEGIFDRTKYMNPVYGENVKDYCMRLESFLKHVDEKVLSKATQPLESVLILVSHAVAVESLKYIVDQSGFGVVDYCSTSLVMKGKNEKNPHGFVFDPECTNCSSHLEKLFEEKTKRYNSDFLSELKELK